MSDANTTQLLLMVSACGSFFGPIIIACFGLWVAQRQALKVEEVKAALIVSEALTHGKLDKVDANTNGALSKLTDHQKEMTDHQKELLATIEKLRSDLRQSQEKAAENSASAAVAAAPVAPAPAAVPGVMIEGAQLVEVYAPATEGEKKPATKKPKA